MQSWEMEAELEAHDSASEVSDEELQGLSPQELKKAIRWAPFALRAGGTSRSSVTSRDLAGSAIERSSRLCRRKKNRDSARRMRAKRVHEHGELKTQVRPPCFGPFYMMRRHHAAACCLGATGSPEH